MTGYPDRLLFRSFVGLTVEEFDSIFIEIMNRYDKHEIQRLSTKRKERRKREIGDGGRHFKLDVKNRLLVLLVYYRLYITCTLAGFLFDLDQSNVCRDMQKIEPLVRKCVPIPQRMHKTTKRLRTPEEVEKALSGFYCLRGLFRAADSKTKEQRKKENVLFGQEEKAYRKDTAYG